MTEAEPIAEDLVLLFAALARRTRDEVSTALAGAGFGDLRPSDGVLVQYLQDGSATIGELAARLGITTQGASKIVIEMERKGYVTRSSSPGDQRKRLVNLTARAWEAIYTTRRARAHVNRQLRAALGSGARPFLDQINQLAETSGALPRA